MTYEYKCRQCDEAIESSSHGLHGKQHGSGCDGPLRRIYSVTIMWPANQRGH